MTWRELQRAWEAAPDDQALLAALIAARRRAGQPVPASLLDRQVFAARTLELPFDAGVEAVLADGAGSVSETPAPGPLAIPAHRRLRVSLFPEDDASVATAVEHLDREGVSELRMWCAGLSASSLAALPRVRSLRDLTLESIGPRPDEELRFLDRMPELERLSLRELPRITGRGLEPIGRMENLVALELRKAPGVDDAALAWLPRLRSLSSFELDVGRRSIGVGDPTLRALGGLTHLEELGLTGCDGIDDAGLGALASLKGLRRLKLSFCEHVGDAVGQLTAELPALRELDVRATRIGDATLRRLAEQGVLEVLDVGGCDLVTDAGLTALASLKLRELTVESSSGGGLAGLPVTLERLELSCSARRQELRSIHLRSLGRLTALRELRLARVRRMSDDILDVLASLPHLAELTIREATRLTPAAVHAVAEAPALRSLSFQGCPGVSGAPFGELARSGALRSLELAGVPVDDADLREIGTVRSLRHLDLDVSDWSSPDRTLAAFTDAGLRSLGALSELESIAVAGLPPGSRGGVEATLRASVPPTCDVHVLGGG